ncbi:MAG: dihydrofolate reductase [Gemella sp.]|nr:dihydrofolate reductase [Gemella sp.]
MISLIVAYDKNRCIGDNNTIPWKSKADMLRVKELTTNQTILMGRKTFESIGRPLPNRINRVLTRDSEYDFEGIEIYTDDNSILEDYDTEKLYIFGGSEIYSKYINYVEEMFITEMDIEVKGDSYFPLINDDEWEIVSKKSYNKDDDNECNYTFIHLKRK